MAHLSFGTVRRDIDLVLFDKDGTLIDFHHIWGARSEAAIGRVLAEAGPRDGLEDALFRTLGYDRGTGRVLGETPLAVAPAPVIANVAATVLFQHGLPWHHCEVIARQTVLPALEPPPDAAELRLIGDVAALFDRLRQAGVRIGIVTTDSRAGTEVTIGHFGWDRLIVGAACGDDDIAPKPAPDGLMALCARAGVAAARTAMVGDSIGDMVAGRAAGCGLVVGVTSGTSPAADLAPHADVVLASVMEIACR